MSCKYVIFFISLLAFNLGQSQNLIPNPSFEDTVHCPTAAAQLTKAKFWLYPSQGSSDYFNGCSGNSAIQVPNNGFGAQVPRTGNAYAGFYVAYKYQHNYNREYIQTQLTSTLLANEKYLVSFYVNLADNPEYAVSSIGAYFSNTQISVSNNNLLPFTPQIQNPSFNPLVDKSNWMLISDTLYAGGGEQYIVIGNFMPDSLSDTLYVGPSTGWFSSYYYIDDVSIVDIGSMGIEDFAKREGIKVYPNPVCDIVLIEAKALNGGQLIITDVFGNIVEERKVSGVSRIGIDTKTFPKGVYFIRVQTGARVITRKIVVQH